MVRELRNIIEDIASIDTSVDIEDVKAIAQFNREADANICKLRDFLLKLDIKPTAERPAVTVDTPCIAVPYSKADAEITMQMYEYQELIELGFTVEQIDAWRNLYNARKTPKTMSFIVCIKACKFVADELKGNSNKVAKTIITQKLKNYLSIIDPDVTYRACNVHDFLRGATLKNISSQFFTCENGYLIGVKHK